METQSLQQNDLIGTKQNLEGCAMEDSSPQFVTNSVDSGLTAMYDAQEAQFQTRNSNDWHPPSRIGIVLFVVGLISLSFFIFIYSIALEERILDYFFISIAAGILLSGLFLLRNSLNVLKLLIAGSFMAILGIHGGIVGSLAIIFGSRDNIIIAFIGVTYLLLTVPTIIASLCALFRRKHRWAMLGGMSGFVLGILLVFYASFLIILSLIGLLLLIMSAENFKD